VFGILQLICPECHINFSSIKSKFFIISETYVTPEALYDKLPKTKQKLEAFKHKNIGTLKCRNPSSNNFSCENPLHVKKKVLWHSGFGLDLHVHFWIRPSYIVLYYFLVEK